MSRTLHGCLWFRIPEAGKPSFRLSCWRSWLALTQGRVAREAFTKVLDNLVEFELPYSPLVLEIVQCIICLDE